MHDTCFICTTPYQIIASASIASECGDSADLLIVPQFLHADEYEARIRNTNLFNEVRLIDTSIVEAYKNRENRFLYGLGIVNNYLKLDEIVNGIVGDIDYKKIYISSQANIGRLISIYFLKRGAEVVYFDDGEGSYDDFKIYEAQGIDKFIRRILFGNDSVTLSNKRKLYCPKLFKKIFGESFDVSSIPNWSDDIELLEKINMISGYTEDAKINHKYILLDTIPSESFDVAGQEIYEKLIDICVKNIGTELLIKRHPRDNRGSKKNCEFYRYSNIPFEVICANSDVEHKVLICSGSSAVLMPKLLFDIEPAVILLHHITGARLGDEEKRETIISYVKDLYRNKQKFIVPESMEEFNEIIRKMMDTKGGF